MRLIVKGKLFTNDGLRDGAVLIENGRIARVARDIDEQADRIIYYNKKGHVILPGLIDMHVHLRDFELGYKEDFFTGTSAAARGGFTVVADMPNTKPEINRPAVLRERERVAKNRALVDYAIYYGVPEREDDLVEGIENSAIGFKVFMQHEFYTDKRELTEKVLEFASRKKMLVVAHAENPQFFVKTPMGDAGTPEAEASAIKDISSYALSHNFPLHVTHLSSSAGADELLRWKKQVGAKVTADTCPHYLLLGEEESQTLGGIAKVHPCVKSRSDAGVLLERLRDGTIDAVSSDHAPHSIEEKKGAKTALPGFPGLETTLPLLLTMVNKKMMSLQDVVRACATNPSRILGLDTAGTIEEGKVGNLTVIDLYRRAKIDSSSFVSKAKYSPFEGREVEGGAVTTIVRGQPVMLEGEIVAQEGWGENVKTYG